jgi:hypothetical protein
METPEVQAIASDEKKMEFIVDKVRASGSKWVPLQERHPLDMDDLRMIAPQIEELKRKGVNLQEYTVVGNKIVLANFEGNMKPDGTRERIQPWWDLGYTIDIFFIIIFCIGVMVTVKRLPNYNFVPDHSKHH